MNEFAFYVAAAIAVLSTALVITRRNAVQALLYLALSLIAVAVVFYGYGAPFIAALEVIVYAGSIVVLFIFVVMMLNLGRRAAQAEARLLPPRIWIGPAVLAAVLLFEIVYLLARGPRLPVAAAAIPPRAVALALYGPYLLGVELASLLLLSALIGAYHLGWRRQPFPEVRDAPPESPAGLDSGRDSVRAGSRRSAGAA